MCSCVKVILLLLLAKILQKFETSAESGLGVHFVRSPESAVAPLGDEVVFECEVNLKPDRLEWSYMRLYGTNYSYVSTFSKKNYNMSHGEIVSKLRVFVTNETLGEYRCVAWFGPGVLTSTTAILTLAAIKIIDERSIKEEPGTIYRVSPKNSILLRCGKVLSQPPAIWNFYRNGVKLQPEDVVTINGALVLNSVAAKDSGIYNCSALNTVSGEIIMLPRGINVRVDYNDTNALRTAPYLLDLGSPTKVTARYGETIILECVGVGNPNPKSVWSSPNIVSIHNNRTKILPYGFKIINVQPEDEGTYICCVDNGVAPALVHKIELTVQTQAQILRGPEALLVNEGDTLELECLTVGNPRPTIYWLINGKNSSNDREINYINERIFIRRVQKRHAGIVQCFAKNNLNEDSVAALLQVNPKQIHGNINGSRPIHKGKRKNNKDLQMVPPSAPNVTRLSDESVMLRWQVPKNNGLPIEFFKVQYRLLGDSSRKIPRENWQTTNDDIPYGKHRNYVNTFTSSVNGLKAGRYYRFRIIAVYVNNDNKESNTSSKFFLQHGSSLRLDESKLPMPQLIDVKAHSESAVILYWTLAMNADDIIEGFYAYYRPAASAGEFSKATIEGPHMRKFEINMLEPGTIYEFKLQSFNSLSASEFSVLKQGRTQKRTVSTEPTTLTIVPTTPSSNESYKMNPIIAGALSTGAILAFVLAAGCCCLRRRKHTQNEIKDKPQLGTKRDNFITLNGADPTVFSQHKIRQQHMNGISHMHITLNPLMQHEGNTPSVHQEQEQRYFQQHSNNQLYDTVTESNFNGLPTHISSLRRTNCSLERGINNNHAFDNLGSRAATNLQNQQQSPNASHVKLKRVRLSSRTDNISCGSLNSIEV